jgi:hypothetical protein
LQRLSRRNVEDLPHELVSQFSSYGALSGRARQTVASQDYRKGSSYTDPAVSVRRRVKHSVFERSVHRFLHKWTYLFSSARPNVATRSPQQVHMSSETQCIAKARV